MSKTLIVVDMQNDFVYGCLGTAEARAIVPKVAEKIRQYRSKGERVIFTRDTHGEDYLNTKEGQYLPVMHCIKGEEGWKIIPDLQADEESCINKPNFGWLHWDEMGLERNSEIELVGVCTDICVISNALILKAQLPETEIVVDPACCAGVTVEKHRAALEVMRSCQVKVL